MDDETPPPVFDPDARNDMFNTFLMMRGLNVRQLGGNPIVTHMSRAIGDAGRHVTNCNGGDLQALRYAAAAFELWMWTADRLVEYGAQVQAEGLGADAGDVERFLFSRADATARRAKMIDDAVTGGKSPVRPYVRRWGGIWGLWGVYAGKDGKQVASFDTRDGAMTWAARVRLDGYGS